jgi:hypothetical protein
VYAGLVRRGTITRGLLVLAAVSCVGVLARADDAAESRFFDGVARDAYARRHWDDAIEGFLRAHRAAPSARLLYNVALAAELAHRDELAFAYYEEYLAQPDSDVSRRDDAGRRHEALGARLALVRVESSPPGAAIFADRRDLGSLGTTPRVVALSAGAHHLELVLDGHHDQATDVTAVVGTPAAVRLALPPRTGWLTAHATPTSATVVARREGAPDLTVTGETELPVGHYELVASAPGYREAHAEVVVAADAHAERSLLLEAVPTPTGRLLVSTGSAHARVSIDGEDRAETPARLTIPVGHHVVDVHAEGFVPWHAEVDVSESRATLVTVDLVPTH